MPSMRFCRSTLWRDSMPRCRSCAICRRSWMRCSRCCARVSICSLRDSRSAAAGDAPGRDGAAMRGSGCRVMAGRCGGVARWISGRGATTRGAAGRDGAAIRGGACGAIAGRCIGGAARNAGAAGRAIAGGAAGRAIAGGAAGRAIAGGAAGRAIAGGGPAGRAAGAAPPPGPWPLPSWADEPVLTAIAETPRKNAARRTPRGSMIATPSCFVARGCQRASAGIVHDFAMRDWCNSSRC